MCTRTIRITSPEKRYRPLVSRGYIDVPCGKCDECRNCAQQEWFVRLWQEMQTYSNFGGQSVFLTLTYNEQSLPRFSYIDEETGEVFNIPCFNKHDKDQFLNSMVQYFKRLGLTRKTTDSGLGLKFMVTSEYGESPDGTHRPHYHCVLLFPREYVEALNFQNVTQWMDFFQKYWPHGFVRKSKKYGLFVSPSSDFAARYTSKYCTKDLDWFDQPEVNEFLYDEFGVKNEQRFNAIKDYLPKHWQSQGFGLGLSKYCEDDIVFKDGINFDFLSDRKLGKTKKYPVPRYIKRKLLYDYDKETGKFTLNERGKSYNRDYVSEIIADSVERISKYISVGYLNTLAIPSEFYQQYQERFHDKDIFLGESSLCKNFRDHLPEGVSLEDVCLYNKFIKGRVCHLDDFKECKWIYKFLDPRKGKLKDICLYFQDISFYDSMKKDVEYSDGFMRDKKFCPEMLFFLDDLPVFKKIDLFLQRIEFLKDYISVRRNKIYREDLKRRKLFKQICS